MSDLRDVNSYLLLHGASEDLMRSVEQAMRVEEAATLAWVSADERFNHEGWAHVPDTALSKLKRALDGDSTP